MVERPFENDSHSRDSHGDGRPHCRVLAEHLTFPEAHLTFEQAQQASPPRVCKFALAAPSRGRQCTPEMSVGRPPPSAFRGRTGSAIVRGGAYRSGFTYTAIHHPVDRIRMKNEDPSTWRTVNVKRLWRVVQGRLYKYNSTL